jgi:hypothetical protein
MDRLGLAGLSHRRYGESAADARGADVRPEQPVRMISNALPGHRPL